MPTVLSNTLLNLLATHYGGAPHAAKRLARDAGTSHRTSQNWLARLCAPSAERLLVLMAANPVLAEEVNALVLARRGARHAEASALMNAAEKHQTEKREHDEALRRARAEPNR